MNTGENTYFIDENDESELARLILQDSLYNTQLPLLPQEFQVDDGSILDLACGPGGWAIQVSLAFPSLSVTGVDISTQMIRYARTQAQVRNLKTQFRLMDILQLPWEDIQDQAYDLVHARFITSLVPTRRLSELYKECWRVLRKGGLLRYTETVGGCVPAAPAQHKLACLANEAIHKAGLSFSPWDMGTGPVTAQILRRLGFHILSLTPYLIDVSANEPYHQPFKEVRHMSVSLLKPFLLKMKVASSEEIDRLQEEFLQEWEDPNFCAYHYLCSIVAIKL